MTKGILGLAEGSVDLQCLFDAILVYRLELLCQLPFLAWQLTRQIQHLHGGAGTAPMTPQTRCGDPLPYCRRWRVLPLPGLVGLSQECSERMTCDRTASGLHSGQRRAQYRPVVAEQRDGRRRHLAAEDRSPDLHANGRREPSRWPSDLDGWERLRRRHGPG